MHMRGDTFDAYAWWHVPSHHVFSRCRILFARMCPHTLAHACAIPHRAGISAGLQCWRWKMGLGHFPSLIISIIIPRLGLPSMRCVFITSVRREAWTVTWTVICVSVKSYLVKHEMPWTVRRTVISITKCITFQKRSVDLCIQSLLSPGMLSRM